MIPALIYSNAWVSCSLAVFSLPYLYSTERYHLALPMLCFIYLTTFLAYAFLHRRFLIQFNLRETNAQANWLYQNRFAMAVVIALHALILFLLFLWYDLYKWLVLAIPALFLVFLYSFEFKKQEQGLRRLLLIKPLCVTSAIIWVCCFLPGFVLKNQTDSYLPANGFMMLSDFLFVFGIVLLFDAHDYDEDKRAGIKTLAQRIGTGKVPILVAALCIASSLIQTIPAFLSDPFHFRLLFPTFGILFLSLAMLFDEPLKRPDPFFGFWFDGLIGLKGFIFYAFN